MEPLDEGRSRRARTRPTIVVDWRSISETHAGTVWHSSENRGLLLRALSNILHREVNLALLTTSTVEKSAMTLIIIATAVKSQLGSRSEERHK